MKRQPRPSTFRHTFGAPTVIGVLSLVGLIAALTGDGLIDWLSWLSLCAPLAALAWAWRRRR